MNKKIRGSLMLLLTAMIWGAAFVAQKNGMEHVGPFTFNMVRMLLGGAALLALIGWRRRAAGRLAAAEPAQTAASRAVTLRGGVLCGVILFIGSTLQQFGLLHTTAGKAGFITTLYIVLVPLFGLLQKKPVAKTLWAGVATAVAGLYLLCVQSGFTLGLGDGLVMLGAGAFTAHILVIDRYSSRADGLGMSCIQFFVCGGLNAVATLAFESPGWAAILAAGVPILYSGLMSSGVGYTLQILAQRDTDPTVASLLMSLESVFAVLAGALLLGERLAGRELLGCALMFAAIALAQLPGRSKAPAAADAAGPIKP